ncbi:tellurite resistance TerB family protein [Marinobacter zhejiangensis]|uniref:Tellurite resistance protein n=1 Tax=Marinobacter zhejiangensis TaxID=488535 RepID=A0A1I4QB42_9GAMM|nr:tellurite resistance TerB family protein [Marinobacter zhejiangensis]SFM36840.1 Tellurite resistance protein [Marinobacter zhejiangensis]
MDLFSSSEALEMAIGAMFIAFHAYGRYNTPASNRSTTTRPRFLACFCLYAATLVVSYWLVTVMAWISPEIVIKVFSLQQSQPADGTSDVTVSELIQSPITTALIFTALLPNFPVLKSADRHLLRLFWDLAEIPGHAVKLAHRMYRAPYYIHPAKTDSIEWEAKTYDIELPERFLKDRGAPAYAWARLCSLLMDVRQWHDAQDTRYQRFFKSCETEIEELLMGYATYSSRISAYYRRLDTTSAKVSDLQKEMAETLMIDGRDLFMKICRLTAHAVLGVEGSRNARYRAIESLGFEPARYDSDALSAVQLFQLSSLILLLFASISTIRYLPSGDLSPALIGEIVFFALLMSANYGLSAFAGIYPKSRWQFADIEATRHRPWLGYACSGAVAVLASLFIISALRLTRYTFEGIGHDQSFDKLLIALSWSYPYLFSSFAIAFGVAWLCDLGNPLRRRRRLQDAFMMGTILLVAAYISHAAMHGLYPFTGTKLPALQDKSMASLALSLLQGALSGAIIGALIPQWYRQNRYRSPLQRVLRFIERNGHQLKVEAGKLDRGVLRQALTTSAAAVALADGVLDEPEREIFRNCLIKLSEKGVLDFGVDDGINGMAATIQRWRNENFESSEQVPLPELQPLRNRTIIAELMIQTASAIAHADGVFREAEQQVLRRIIGTLNLDMETEMEACGAVQCDDFLLKNV